MSRTRQLSELRDDVRYLADIERATDRHPDADLTRLINQSVQAWRELVSDAGHTFFLTIDSGTTSAGSSTIALAAGYFRVYGIDVEYQSEWRELYPYEFAERNKYESAIAGTEQGVPVYYRPRYASTVIDIMPTSDAAYNYRVHGLAVPTDLSNDADTFDGIAGWEDWVVYDVACKVATRDANVNDNYELLAAERAKIEQRIVSAAGKAQLDKPTRRIDTRGRRRGLERAGKWHWWTS